MLEIKQLGKHYGSYRALDNVSLALEAGKTHVILGSSGSGKSTLLRAVFGLIACDEGSIRFEGREVRTMSPRERAGRMGYVPQDGGLFPHLRAEENISLVARALGWKKERIQARLRELLPLVSLNTDLLDRYPKELSGGQKQRVAIFRAAFLDPDLLIFDEPLGALDPLIRADLQVELKSMFARLQKTVVFVTHDIGEAVYLGDHLVLMHEGKIVQEGTFQDLRERPRDPFVTRFLSAQRILERGEV